MDTIAMTAVYPHDAAYAARTVNWRSTGTRAGAISPAKTPLRKRLRSISTECTWTKRASRRCLTNTAASG